MPELALTLTAERIGQLYTDAVIDKLKRSDLAGAISEQIANAVANDQLAQRALYKHVVLELLRQLGVDFSDRGALLYLSVDGSQFKQCAKGDWIDVGKQEVA